MSNLAEHPGFTALALEDGERLARMATERAMALGGNDPIVSAQRRWYVALTEGGRERTAAGWMVGYGVSFYLPMVFKTEVCRGRQRSVSRAMFPGYLFVHVARTERRWQRMRTAPGIRDMLAFDGHLATLTDLDIEDIRFVEAECGAAVTQGSAHEFEPGEVVRVRKGPFASFNGRIDDLDDHERISLLLSIFGRETRVHLPADHLEKL